jgi:aspartate racemase
VQPLTCTSAIIRNTPAKTDQDHLRIIIDSHPQIPDRTKALNHRGLSPIPFLVDSIKLLKNAGAEYIACPCNTAHVFLRKISQEIQFHFIDMIEETVQHLKKKGIKKAGLLSTEGTANSNIFQETAIKENIQIITPSEAGIIKEMEAIYGIEGIKAGIVYEKSKKNKTLLLEVLNELYFQGCSTIIMGCTEIPLCLDESDTNLQLVNPTEILAKSIVNFALSE